MKLGFLIYSYFPYGGQQRDFHRIVQESSSRILFLSPLQWKAFEKYYPNCGDRLFQVPPVIDRDRRVTDAAPIIRKKFRNEFNFKDDSLAMRRSQHNVIP